MTRPPLPEPTALDLIHPHHHRTITLDIMTATEVMVKQTPKGTATTTSAEFYVQPRKSFYFLPFTSLLVDDLILEPSTSPALSPHVRLI